MEYMTEITFSYYLSHDFCHCLTLKNLAQLKWFVFVLYVKRSDKSVSHRSIKPACAYKNDNFFLLTGLKNQKKNFAPIILIFFSFLYAQKNSKMKLAPINSTFPDSLYAFQLLKMTHLSSKKSFGRFLAYKI